jgi:hypothetical protein
MKAATALSMVIVWLLSGCSVGPCGPQLRSHADWQRARAARHERNHTIPSYKDYLGITAFVTFLWAGLGTLLAFRIYCGPTVYCASTALAIIPVTISQFEFGLLPTVGLIHILACGLYPLGVFAFVSRYRDKRRSF